jgi:putative transcriptional regulator
MRFVETPVFTRGVTPVLDDEHYRSLQPALVLRAGKNSRQACPQGVQVREQDFRNLVKSVRQAGRIRRGQMKPSRVYTFRPTEIKSIRSKLGKSQSEFALMIGVSVATLQNWEQGRRTPAGPAKALLKVAAQNPEAVAEALSAYTG